MSGHSIDYAALNELKEIMEDDFDELITTFISDGHSLIKNLQVAIDLSIVPDIRRIAHTLKGSSANFGAHPLSQACNALELNASDNTLDDANDLLEKIKTEFESVKSELKEKF